jgi:hypothetical protein
MSTNPPAPSILPIPNRLLRLLSSGRWPRPHAEALKQNVNSLVAKERIQSFAPKEDTIFLYPPPFRTVATDIASRQKRGRDRFWSTDAALDDISPELSLIIGDLGLGSDAPILLDYRHGGSNPPVIRLEWRKPTANVWVRCAGSFEEFADMLGLDVKAT